MRNSDVTNSIVSISSFFHFFVALVSIMRAGDLLHYPVSDVIILFVGKKKLDRKRKREREREREI